MVSLLSVGAPFLFLDVHLQGTWQQRPRNIILPWQWAQWICLAHAGQQRVNLFDTATQIAVYHLKYRVQSEEKGHGVIILWWQKNYFFSLYSVPTSHLLNNRIGNYPRFLLEACFILFPQPEKKKGGLLAGALQLCTGCRCPMILCPLLRLLNPISSLCWVGIF